MSEIKVGDQVRDLLGHVYTVLDTRAGGWQFLCQSHTLSSCVVWMGRSELRQA